MQILSLIALALTVAAELPLDINARFAALSIAGLPEAEDFRQTGGSFAADLLQKQQKQREGPARAERHPPASVVFWREEQPLAALA